MNLPIFFTLWITLQYNNYLTAVNISAKNNLANYKYPALIVDLLNEQYGTACPASTEREIKFNEEVSVSGKGVFLRNIYYRNESIVSSICHEPFEPVMLYNLQTRKYDIGYELYYEEGKMKLEESIYFHYRSVNTNNEIINKTKSSSQYVVDSQAGNSTKFNFNDGSPALVNSKYTLKSNTYLQRVCRIFHWIPKLSFTYSAHTKQTKVLQDNTPLKEYTSIKCPKHGLSEIDMKVYLSTNADKNHLTLWKDQQSYGALEMSQIIPVRYFSKPAEILAACSHMNMVPIWKSIANGQLKKVDSYLQGVTKLMDDATVQWCIGWVSFGVSGMLEEPITKQKMYFSDIKNNRQTVIPKIIYRMIEGNTNRGVFNAVIVIHNDPTRISDSDRVCTKEDEVPGWEDITNDDPRTGFTYVCHYRLKKVSLPGIFDSDFEDLLSRPFRLDEVPTAYIDDPYISRVMGVCFDDEDLRGCIQATEG